MRHLAAALAVAALFAPAARADYVVMRNGLRVHVTGYVRDGETLRLTLEGGEAQVPAADVVSIEPEDRFTPLPAPPPAVSAGPYDQIIRAAAQENGVDEELIRSVIAAESNFDPHAISPRHAMGLMQLLPETAARYSVKDIFDPAQNVSGGTRYLKDLLGQYHGDLALTLAAYNAGPDRVQQYRGIPPFAETRAYVRRVTKRYAEKKKGKETAARN